MQLGVLVVGDLAAVDLMFATFIAFFSVAAARNTMWSFMPLGFVQASATVGSFRINSLSNKC